MTPSPDNLDFFYNALLNKINEQRYRRMVYGFSASRYGNPFAYQPNTQLLPREDHFFGKTGDLIARFIPGMTVVGKDGRRTPVFKTNFTLKNSDRTGWQNMMARQNAKVRAAMVDYGADNEPFSTDNLEKLIRYAGRKVGVELPG